MSAGVALFFWTAFAICLGAAAAYLHVGFAAARRARREVERDLAHVQSTFSDRAR